MFSRIQTRCFRSLQAVGEYPGFRIQLVRKCHPKDAHAQLSRHFH